MDWSFKSNLRNLMFVNYTIYKKTSFFRVLNNWLKSEHLEYKSLEHDGNELYGKVIHIISILFMSIRMINRNETKQQHCGIYLKLNSTCLRNESIFFEVDAHPAGGASFLLLNLGANFSGQMCH